ncbi:unnamed protein product [Caenorhabditis brenneri]
MLTWMSPMKARQGRGSSNLLRHHHPPQPRTPVRISGPSMIFWPRRKRFLQSIVQKTDQ